LHLAFARGLDLPSLQDHASLILFLKKVVKAAFLLSAIRAGGAVFLVAIKAKC
jgi:hypothetical protein